MDVSSEHQKRKCVACAERGDKRQLLRLVWDGRGVVADPEQRLAGRGAYLHKTRGCAARACDPKRWERALRLAAGSVSMDGLAAVRELANAGDGKGGASGSPRMGRVRL